MTIYTKLPFIIFFLMPPFLANNFLIYPSYVFFSVTSFVSLVNIFRGLKFPFIVVFFALFILFSLFFSLLYYSFVPNFLLLLLLFFFSLLYFSQIKNIVYFRSFIFPLTFLHLFLIFVQFTFPFSFGLFFSELYSVSDSSHLKFLDSRQIGIGSDPSVGSLFSTFLASTIYLLFRTKLSFFLIFLLILSVLVFLQSKVIFFSIILCFILTFRGSLFHLFIFIISLVSFYFLYFDLYILTGFRSIFDGTSENFNLRLDNYLTIFSGNFLSSNIAFDSEVLYIFQKLGFIGLFFYLFIHIYFICRIFYQLIHLKLFNFFTVLFPLTFFVSTFFYSPLFGYQTYFLYPMYFFLVSNIPSIFKIIYD